MSAIDEAVKAVARELRGRPQDEAEQTLTEALRERGLVLPSSHVRLVAWHHIDPWRAVKHPFRTRRDLRRLMEPTP